MHFYLLSQQSALPSPLDLIGQRTGHSIQDSWRNQNPVLSLEIFNCDSILFRFKTALRIYPSSKKVSHNPFLQRFHDLINHQPTWVPVEDRDFVDTDSGTTHHEVIWWADDLCTTSTYTQTGTECRARVTHVCWATNHETQGSSHQVTIHPNPNHPKEMRGCVNHMHASK